MMPADGWLRQFPEATQLTVASWFRHVRSRGVTNPTTMVAKVEVLCTQKLSWAVATESRQLCEQTLAALRCDVPGARAYAASVLQQSVLTSKEPRGNTNI